MYELLLRTETLLTGLRPLVLLGIGAVALAIGLVFWLGGIRYSTAITALLGAVVGAAVGLIVGQQFGTYPWLSMLVGAVIMAVLAILLKKALVLVLAVLIISAVSGAGYVSLVLDRMAPPPASETTTEQTPRRQSFLRMELDARQNYVNKISNDSPTFSDRVKAVLADTWSATEPYRWTALIAIIIGAVVALVFVWLISKLVIALAYSIVGVAAIFLGLQASLLAVNVRAASGLYTLPWLLPIVFLVMVVVGWIWQLFFLRPVKVKEEEHREKEEEHREVEEKRPTGR